MRANYIQLNIRQQQNADFFLKVHPRQGITFLGRQQNTFLYLENVAALKCNWGIKRYFHLRAKDFSENSILNTVQFCLPLTFYMKIKVE